MEEDGSVDGLFDLSFEDGIAFFVFKPIHIDLILAQLIAKKRIEHFKGETWPVFLDLSNLISMDSAARRYIASPEGSPQISARAVYSCNPLITLAAEVFVYVNEPSVITKVFRDREEAINWLCIFKRAKAAE